MGIKCNSFARGLLGGRMLTPAENELLCRVEGDAPMGKIMRHYWMPACLSEEIPEADGKPIQVRLLGENFVAFRDSNGEVGVMDVSYTMDR